MKILFKTVFLPLFLISGALFSPLKADTRRQFDGGCDTIVCQDNKLILATEIRIEKKSIWYWTCNPRRTEQMISLKKVKGLRYADGKRWENTAQLSSVQGDKSKADQLVRAILWTILIISVIVALFYIGILIWALISLG